MKFKLILQDGVYTGMLNGHIFMSDTLTTEQVKVLVGNPTEEQIIEIFNPKIAEVKKSNRQLQELQDVLIESGLFEEKNGSYYRVGNPISMPKMLLERYKELLNRKEDTTTQENELEVATNDIEALDNFWLKCSLNPDSRAREDLFWFLEKWGFTITPKGYFVAYKNLDIHTQGNKELHDFVATNYTKIKGQKKAPKNYIVYKNGDSEYILHQQDVNVDYDVHVGNLQELYNNLVELAETVYKDNYTGKMRIRIGVPAKEDRSIQCSDPNQLCAKGLHQGAAGWLKHNYFGTEGVVCLVNPMNVVAVPKADFYGKMRVCEYLPIGLVEYDENGNIPPMETSLWEDDYDVYTLEELNKLLQEIDSSNQVIHKLEFQELSNKVYTSIDEYRQILESKNVNIYAEDNEFDYYGEDDYNYYNEEE